jgi:hypothetical protein
MKRLALFALGVLSALLLLIPIARLRQFILEPDYIRVVRCDGGMEGPKVRTTYDGKYFKVFDARQLRR